MNANTWFAVAAAGMLSINASGLAFVPETVQPGVKEPRVVLYFKPSKLKPMMGEEIDLEVHARLEPGVGEPVNYFDQPAHVVAYAWMVFGLHESSLKSMFYLAGSTVCDPQFKIMSGLYNLKGGWGWMAFLAMQNSPTAPATTTDSCLIKVKWKYMDPTHQWVTLGFFQDAAPIMQKAYVTVEPIDNPGIVLVMKFEWAFEPLHLEVNAPPCFADCDNDGTLDINDFICYQTLFALGDPAADCDGDGMLLINDFVCFQTAFVLGC
jgi:hypothetical protein